MRARTAGMSTPLMPDLERALPIITEGSSDTMSFDECLELLHLGGRSLAHGVLMMIPEAWENHATMSPERRAFYRYHASLMEPWDGPASIAFTDGTVIGAVLDRNGLRPSRYWVTDDDRVIMASEAGVVDIDPARVVKKGRLQPGRMFLVDTSLGRIVDDEEIKSTLASDRPEGNLLDPQPDSCHQIELPFPILDNDDLAKLIHINDDGQWPEFAARVISGLYEVAGGGAALRAALDRVRAEATAAIDDGVRII